MLWTRREIKQKARVNLHRFYWPAVLACIIFTVLQGFAGNIAMPGVNQMEMVEEVANGTGSIEELSMEQISAMAGLGGVTRAASLGTNFAAMFGILLLTIFLNFFIINPMQVGIYGFFYKSRFYKTSVGELAAPFNKKDFLPVVRTMFLRGLYVSLWTLLLVVPGFIKAYEYCMVDFILSENPTMPTRQALQISRNMMYGHKWNVFVLDLSFIGWNLLGGLTFGMSDIFFKNPYRFAVYAELYEKLKNPIRNESAQADAF